MRRCGNCSSVNRYDYYDSPGLCRKAVPEALSCPGSGPQALVSVAPNDPPTYANHHAHVPSGEEPSAREGVGAPNGRVPTRVVHRPSASSLRARHSPRRAVDRIPRFGVEAEQCRPPCLRNIDAGVRPQRCIHRAGSLARKLLPAYLHEKTADSYVLQAYPYPLNASRAQRFTRPSAHSRYTDAGPPGYCLSVRCGQHAA